MIKGQYKIYQEGELLAVVNNLITTEGKKYIQRYLAGQVGRIASSVACGIGGTAATVADTRLQFEIARYPVVLTSADLVNSKLVFKATLPPEVVGTIYELGLWSLDTNIAAGNYSSKLITGFDGTTELWSTGTFNATNARVGADALRLTASASSSSTSEMTNVFYDFSGYSTADQFVLATNGDANTASIKVRFKTDASNYYEITFSTIAAGYQFLSWTKNQMTATGTPSLANITSIEIVVTAKAGGATTVDLDAIRVEDTDTFSSDYVLVSRGIPGSPIVKGSSAPLDIEYTVGVAFA